MIRTGPRVGFLLLAALACGTLGGSWAPTSPSFLPLPAPRQDDDEVPRFEESACDWPVPDGEEAAGSVLCGYLVVPERHDKPAGPTLKLALMVFGAYGARMEYDPIVWNTGGPGGSTIDDYGWFLAQSPLRENRHIILMDQRGTGHSLPRLECPEVDWSGKGDLATCTAVNARKGIDLRAFNTREAAADLADLRSVFYIGKLNLYGVSYGSLLVLETLRSFSPEVRSAVIDGVVPPGVDPFDVEHVAALDLIVDHCARDEECSHFYPALRDEYQELLSRERTTPGNPLWVSGMDETLREAMYWQDDLPTIPLVVHLANAGLDGYLNALLFSPLLPPISEVPWMTFFCSDIGPASSGLVTDTGFCAGSEDGGSQAEATVDGAQPWNPDGIDWNEPVYSEVPVLILNGEFDPITPPAYGERVAETLPNSYNLMLPGYAHGAAVDWGCADSMIAAFYENPDTPPDSSCIAALPPLRFLGPGAASRVVLRQPVGADLLISGLTNAEAASSWVWPVVGRALLVFHAVWSVHLGLLLLASVFSWSRRRRNPAVLGNPSGRFLARPLRLAILALSILAVGAISYTLSRSVLGAFVVGVTVPVLAWLPLRSTSPWRWRKPRAEEQTNDGSSASASRPKGILLLMRSTNLLALLSWVLAGWVLADLVLFAIGLRTGPVIVLPLLLRPYSQVASVLLVLVAALAAAGGVLRARSEVGPGWRRAARSAPALSGVVFLFLLLPLAILGLAASVG